MTARVLRVATLNAGAHKGLLVVLVIVVAQLVWDLGRWALNLRRAAGTA